MKKNTIFAILQQCEYEYPCFEKWYAEHKHDDVDIQPDTWTLKLKLLSIGYWMMGILPLLKRIKILLLCIKVPEKFIRYCIYSLAWLKLQILKLFGLKIIAIAGSYAKTSTKHILTHVLEKDFNVYATPKSYNVLLSIARVILKNLSFKHKVFIVEFGEFDPNDIKFLARLSQPDYGIITPIGRQHIERFGSVKEIAKNISHLAEYLGWNKNRLLVAEENKKFFKNRVNYYGKSKSSEFSIFHSQISRNGTEFTVGSRNKPVLSKVEGFEMTDVHIFIPLFGEHQAVNTLPSFWIAQKLELSYKKVASQLATLPYLTRRHEPTFAQNNVLILDNSYNTNPDSVRASLELIQKIEVKRRILITLGFVELGEQASQIHQEFGKQLVHKVDYVGLVQGPNTQDIIDGFICGGGKKSHIKVGESQEDVLNKLHDTILPNSLILFEGGYREVYV